MHARTNIHAHTIACTKTPHMNSIGIAARKRRRFAQLCTVTVVALLSNVGSFQTVTFVFVSCCKTRAKMFRVNTAERVNSSPTRITIVFVPMTYPADVANVRIVCKPNMNKNPIMCTINHCTYQISVYIANA